jgi:hypothetical protein
LRDFCDRAHAGVRTEHGVSSVRVAVVPSVRIQKTLPFKGGTRVWGNRYHFVGGVPPDDTHWHTLMDAIVTAEKAIHSAEVTIIEALGYAAGSDVPVSTKVYSTVGTGSFTGSPRAGESAALVRWSTAAKSTKNHPIYCFNYYHHVWADTSVNADKVSPGQKTAMGTYATSWITGFSDGGAVTAKRSTPQGAVAIGSLAEEYVTHRDFPYTTSV